MSFVKRGRRGDQPKIDPTETTPVETEETPLIEEVQALATETAPVETEETVVLRVAPGRSVMTGSQRGMLLPGDEAKPEFFSGGQSRIDQLRRAGYLI